MKQLVLIQDVGKSHEIETIYFGDETFDIHSLMSSIYASEMHFRKVGKCRSSYPQGQRAGYDCSSWAATLSRHGVNDLTL